MKWAVALLALGFFHLSSAFAQQVDALAKRHGWLDDYQKARKVARKSGKPLFVVFRCQP